MAKIGIEVSEIMTGVAMLMTPGDIKKYSKELSRKNIDNLIYLIYLLTAPYIPANGIMTSKKPIIMIKEISRTIVIRTIKTTPDPKDISCLKTISSRQ